MMTSEWVISDTHAQGRRMVAEGTALMAKGVVETVKEEIRSAAFMSVIGAMWGLVRPPYNKGNLSEKVINSVKESAKFGAIFGWFVASLEHNQKVQTPHAQRVGVADWAIALVTSVSAYKEAFPFTRMGMPGRMVLTQLANPMTIAGAKIAIGGLGKIFLS